MNARCARVDKLHSTKLKKIAMLIYDYDSLSFHRNLSSKQNLHEISKIIIINCMRSSIKNLKRISKETKNNQQK